MQKSLIFNLDTLYLRYINAHQISNENISARKASLVRRNVRVRGKKVSKRYLAIIQRSISSDAEFAKKIPFRRQSIFPFGKSSISPLQDPIQYQGFDDYYCQQVFIKLIFDISVIELDTLFLHQFPVQMPAKEAITFSLCLQDRFDDFQLFLLNDKYISKSLVSTAKVQNLFVTNYCYSTYEYATKHNVQLFWAAVTLQIQSSCFSVLFVQGKHS